MVGEARAWVGERVEEMRNSGRCEIGLRERDRKAREIGLRERDRIHLGPQVVLPRRAPLHRLPISPLFSDNGQMAMVKWSNGNVQMVMVKWQWSNGKGQMARVKW